MCLFSGASPKYARAPSASSHAQNIQMKDFTKLTRECYTRVTAKRQALRAYTSKGTSMKSTLACLTSVLALTAAAPVAAQSFNRIASFPVIANMGDG